MKIHVIIDQIKVQLHVHQLKKHHLILSQEMLSKSKMYDLI